MEEITMKIVSSKIFSYAEDGKPNILLEEAYFGENEALPTDHIADGSKAIILGSSGTTVKIKYEGEWKVMQ